MTPKELLVDRLQALCDANGGPEGVAEKAGVSAENLAQVLAGTPLPSGRPRGIGPSVAERLEKAFPNWAVIAPGHDNISLSGLGASNDGSVNVAQFKTGGRMGSGLVLRDQPGVIRRIEFSSEWAQKNLPAHTGVKNLAVVTGFGDSMKGMFNPGDPLIVDCGVKTVEFDSVFFFRVGEEGFIKRLQRIPGHGIRVISANKEYEPWTITKKMQSDFEVFGRVLIAWRGESF